MPNKWGVKALIDQARGRRGADEEFNVRYYSIGDLLESFSAHIGPSSFSVDCFLGLNVRPRDRRFVPLSKRLVIDCASVLAAAAHLAPPFRRLADSVFVTATKADVANGAT